MRAIKGRCQFVTRLVACVFAAFAVIGSAGATSANTDATDLWWNKNKSGNGYQLINTGTFLFVTGYLYGANRQPFWITAELQKTGPATFTGQVYVNSGPPFGGPYNPATVTQRQAGTMTFVFTAVSAAHLSYSVDGVFVDESVERQPLTMDNYNGLYLAALTNTASGCNNPANNGTRTSAGELSVTQNGQSMVMVATSYTTGVACTINGTYSQLGRMGTLQGPYACNDGEVGNALVFEMNNTGSTMTARLQTQSTNIGCNTAGAFAGLIPR